MLCTPADPQNSRPQPEISDLASDTARSLFQWRSARRPCAGANEPALILKDAEPVAPPSGLGKAVQYKYKAWRHEHHR